MAKQWTNRAVHFTPYPRTPSDAWETFFDALPDHYWERPGWLRRFLEPSIGSVSSVVHISGFPWWMPRHWAMRTVARIAERSGVGGHATYVVERVVL